jgi:hypothetical protein
MGLILMRKGEAEHASERFSQSMAKLSALDHTYVRGMNAWCACGLGDV